MQLATAAVDPPLCSMACAPSEICIVNENCRVVCDTDCTQGSGEKPSNCIDMCGPCGVHC
jgi:hypothetical protein